MLMNSIPPELLKMKMSVLTENLYNQNNPSLKNTETDQKVEDEVNTARNCNFLIIIIQVFLSSMINMTQR